MNRPVIGEIRCAPFEEPSASSGGFRRGIALALLLTHGALVGWEGLRWSPTIDEVAHLTAGLSHWEFGSFDLYRVNPPLIRMIAAAPLLALGPKADWDDFSEKPYARPEFAIGAQFARKNGSAIFGYFTLARWACLPVSLLGAWICFCWGRELYGSNAGLVALTLYCLCPNVVGHAALITPDAGAAAFGVLAGYRFWRWLRQPSPVNMALAGISLGIAELTKSSWIILFGLWPVMTLLWELLRAKTSMLSSTRSLAEHSRDHAGLGRLKRRFGQLATLIAIALYVLNLGYGFEDSFQPLGEFQFISHKLGGVDSHNSPSNRFAGTWLGRVPVPVPANYLRGMDFQCCDFEIGRWSYLRGVQQMGGWWYYYLYALSVKVPAGTLLLVGLAAIHVVARKRRGDEELVRNDMIVLAPAVALLILVSSQTGFSRYFRYVLPMFPFVFVWISQVGQWLAPSERPAQFCALAKRRVAVGRFGAMRTTLQLALAICVVVSLLTSAASSLAVWPHSLSYFNEFVRGPLNGPAHLLDANIDWGQDLLEFRRWHDAHPDARPLYFTYFGFVDPHIAGLDLPPVPGQPPLKAERGVTVSDGGPLPGWHAVSINRLYGYKHLGNENDEFAYLRQLNPVARAGYSISIFHITPDEANQMRADMGLPTVRFESK
ncbi:MAG: ArnT family glycosyltransferase [Planctomycetales bacterium]